MRILQTVQKFVVQLSAGNENRTKDQLLLLDEVAFSSRRRQLTTEV